VRTLFILLLTFSFTYANSNVSYADKKASLKKLHEKFLKIDVHSKDLDLDKAIKDIKQARKKFPLDDKLKMIDMELENRRANEAYKPTKNSTPNN
jgi:hypothetical protein